MLSGFYYLTMAVLQFTYYVQPVMYQQCKFAPTQFIGALPDKPQMPWFYDDTKHTLSFNNTLVACDVGVAPYLNNTSPYTHFELFDNGTMYNMNFGWWMLPVIQDGNVCYLSETPMSVPKSKFLNFTQV